MQQQNVSISTLVDMYKRGELRLPEIQRHYVWRSTQVRDLFDSLYRGYPSGSILMWETDEPIPMRDFALGQETTAFAGRKLLLDGQQRLTSLTAVLSGQPVTVRGRKRPIRILFNLDHPDGPPASELDAEVQDESPLTPDDEIADEADDPDEAESGGVVADRLNLRTFIVASKALEARRNWVSVSDVFEKGEVAIIQAAGVTEMTDPRFAKYQARLAKLKAIAGYSYVVHVLERGMSYEEVTEIFVRVNSLGAKLRSSDLALAQMSSRWPNLLKDLEAFQEECEDASNFTIDLGQLVRAIVVFATRQCLFRAVASTPIETLKTGWEEAKAGLRFAINFLRTNAGIEDETLLSSPMFLHALAAFSRVKSNQLDPSEQQALLHWLLVANARGRYSRGATETLLNEDLNIIFRRGDAAEMLETLKRQFGRLHIEPGDLAGRGAGSPLFSLSYLALKDAGAKDWFSGLGLSLTHQGRLHFIQWHHIFPKALLHEHSFETGEINEIANMAFITGDTNRRIGRKDPAKYLVDVVAKQGTETLTAQCVPAEIETLTVDRYRDFLSVRRAALAERMNTFIAKKAGG